MDRRTFLIGAPLACSAGIQAAQAQPAAAPYPQRQIRLVVPFAPGGGTDAIGRLAAQILTDRLGQPAIVANVAGAGGTIGAAEVAKAAPDGYTLVMGSPGSFTVNPHIQKNIPYDAMKDFEPVTQITSGAVVLVVHKDLPVHSVADLVKLARERPGVLNYASSGNGAIDHLAGELFNHLAGVKMTHIPYKGSAPATLDLVAGRVQLMITNPPPVMAQIQSGGVRALAVGTLAPSSFFPDLPTIDRSGVSGYDWPSWFGLFAPARTPRPVLERIASTIAAGLRDQASLDTLRKLGVEPAASTPEAFSAFIRKKHADVGTLVKSAGIALD